MKLHIAFSLEDGRLVANGSEDDLIENLSNGYWIIQQRDFGKITADTLAQIITKDWKWNSKQLSRKFIEVTPTEVFELDHPES